MKHAEVLVAGAGPAGIAAAAAAAESGKRVILLDDNMAPGGQIWRGGFAPAARTKSRGEDAKYRALSRLSRSGAEVLSGYRVFDVCGPAAVRALREDTGEAITLHYEQLVIATGARERFLPFPGWTLPGVFGAGGLQALVKGGFSVAGKRVVLAGTGPLLLAVAAHLKCYGARVMSVNEQASKAQLAPFAVALWRQPGKIWQGLRYRAMLGRTPYRTSCWVTEAISRHSETALSAVRLTDGRRVWDEPCDLLACGFHLVPNTELAALLGCALRDNFVSVDTWQRTSIANVYCVGEPAGIAGLEAALVQGEIAGLACAGGASGFLQRRAAAERAFASRLERAFALRDELLRLAKADTIICRCEDVRLEQLSGRTGWTDAKLQTRCGMGPCQGRVCGPAVEALLGWKPGSVRPPLFPVPVSALRADEES